MMRVLCFLALLAPAVSDPAVDEGFELLVEDAAEEVAWSCQTVARLPAYLDGTLLMPTAAQFSMGDRKFQSILDAFGKWNKIQISAGKVCFAARMLASKFYNQSVQKKTIAAGMLFDETVPPRKCPFPLCNLIEGGQDNVYVKTYDFNGKYVATTDAPMFHEFDPQSLGSTGKLLKFGQDFKPLFAHMATLGAAHMVKDPKTGHLIGVQQEASETGSGNCTVDIYDVDVGPPSKRTLKARYQTKKLRYFHSIGITPKYAVLPHQPYTFDIMAAAKGDPMKEAFKVDPDGVLEFHLVRRDIPNAEPQVFNADRFFYQHVSNSFENATGVTIDLGHAPKFLLSGPMAEIVPTASKKVRDSTFVKSSIRRYHLHTSGPSSGSVTSQTLSDPRASTEFVRINERFKGQAYCFYYANEWFHGGSSAMGAMAVVKQNVCTGERTYWSKPAHFPSEPTFVEATNHGAEDDGVLLFTTLDGSKKVSYITVVDAKTMTELASVELPTRLSYTTHGTWFHGLHHDLKTDKMMREDEVVVV